MKLKLLVVLALLLVFTGFLLFNEQARGYFILLGSMTRSLAGKLGNFIGNFIKVQGESINFKLSLNKEGIRGQSFSFSDSGLKASGLLIGLKVDGKNWEKSEKIEVELTGSGEVSFTSEGKLVLKADAKSFSFDGLKTSNVKVEVSLVPESFYLGSGKKDLMNMSSVSGKVIKRVEELELIANFSQANLKIEGFSGLVEVGNETRIEGTATNIEINGKKI